MEVEEMLPERFFYPEELLFEKKLFEAKGYRIDPIKRDGNCLFRAVAGAIHANTELYVDIRKKCVEFMEKEKEYFKPFVQVVNDYNVLVKDFDAHISVLRQEAAWGGEPEIVALSGILKCKFEVYKTSVIPTLLKFPKVIDNSIDTFRLYYRNKHYSIVRSDGVGNQLFNFEGLQDKELKRQQKILFEAKHPNASGQSEQNLSLGKEEELAHAIKLSIAQEEAEKNYLRFNASRIMKGNTNEQN